MTNTTLTFTRADVNAAINAALSKVTDERWIRAIYRAAANLASGQFMFDGTYVMLHSASSNKTYTIDTREPMRCSCRAHAKGLVCWHITAARLLVRAAEHRYAAELTNGGQSCPPHPFDDGATTFAELTAAADELFA